jgi:GAF domain-containing protein
VHSAQKVHQQALGATPKQSLFLDELIVLERIADRFNEADALVDVQHAVAALTSLVGADDVSIGLVDEDEEQLVSVSHHTWVDVGDVQNLDENPLLRWIIDTRRAAQVLAGDSRADPAQQARLRETGYGGVLLVPIITRGLAIGLLSLYRTAPEPWTLAEIRYSRIGVSHLAAALDRLVSRDAD